MRSVKIEHAAALLTLLLAGCGPDKEKVAACQSAWDARIAAVAAQSTLLDDAQGFDEKSVADATKAAQKRLETLTVTHRDRDMYPERLKGVVASAHMRLGSITPTRQDPPGKALRSVRYDFEISGDYRAIAKTVAALYAQPKAFFLDSLEVNITDEYRKLATLKGTAWVYELDLPNESAPAAGAPSPAFNAAIAKAAAPAECQGVKDKEWAEKWEGARAALASRADQAGGAKIVEDRKAAAASLASMADDLLKRRDDNKAQFTTHADELVGKAKAAVTGLAELKFGSNGEPIYK